MNFARERFILSIISFRQILWWIVTGVFLHCSPNLPYHMFRVGRPCFANTKRSNHEPCCLLFPVSLNSRCGRKWTRPSHEWISRPVGLCGASGQCGQWNQRWFEEIETVARKRGEESCSRCFECIIFKHACCKNVCKGHWRFLTEMMFQFVFLRCFWIVCLGIDWLISSWGGGWGGQDGSQNGGRFF